jgi:ubiquinone/menaquinone biosynthesis C-methylase UbiE
LREILCDPISKSPLRIEPDCLTSDFGGRYPVVDGVYDLRPLCCHVGVVGQLWRRGQDEYEEYSAKLARESREDYAAQRLGVEDVYRAIPVSGRCLDVGGNDGRLRAFLAPQQQYVSIDPYLSVIREPRSAQFKQVYPFMDEPLNFMAAFAEHLPFSNQSFDVVHMRSVIDHFLNPELALREAFRVLNQDGSLIVGLTVEGGKTGRNPMRIRLKKTLRAILACIGLHRFRDHHVWHPTYHELCELIQESGFRVNRTHWQKSEQERVCYIQASKRSRAAGAHNEHRVTRSAKGRRSRAVGAQQKFSLDGEST